MKLTKLAILIGLALILTIKASALGINPTCNCPVNADYSPNPLDPNGGTNWTCITITVTPGPPSAWTPVGFTGQTWTNSYWWCRCNIAPNWSIYSWDYTWPTNIIDLIANYSPIIDPYAPTNDFHWMAVRAGWWADCSTNFPANWQTNKYWVSTDYGRCSKISTWYQNGVPCFTNTIIAGVPQTNYPYFKVPGEKQRFYRFHP